MVLNGQQSLWSSIEAGVLQESIVVPFFVCINGLQEKLTTNSKSRYVQKGQQKIWFITETAK